MRANSLIILKVWRLPSYGDEDTLVLQPGVNVIAGLPQTGKSKWLQMIDYLLGRPDKPEDALGTDIFDKFDSVHANVLIGGKEVLLERKWKLTGARGKVFVDGEGILVGQLSTYLLNELDIPLIHLPRQPGQTWPELSWRELYRHIYRRQGYWSSFVPEQLPLTTRICVTLFLGLAELIYSNEYGQSITKKQELKQLQNTRDDFIDVFHDLYEHVVDSEQMTVSPTRESMRKVLTSLQTRLESYTEKRHHLAEEVLSSASSSIVSEDLARKTDLWSMLAQDRDQKFNNLRAIYRRRRELTSYEDSLSQEQRRLERAKTAGRLFADLKITHCPSCDQSVDVSTSASNASCGLCKQLLNSDPHRDQRAIQRLEFEEHQISGEVTEIHELLDALAREQADTEEALSQIDTEIAALESLMTPLRNIAASIMPPEISELDAQIGKIEERVRLFARLESLFDKRDDWAKRVDDLTAEIAEMDAELVSKRKEARFESKSQVLADGMNSYLNYINSREAERWTHEPVSVKLSKSNFDVRIGGDPYSTKLGGTRSLYLLMSYHYALLSLSNKESYFYPGLVIIDLPAVLNAESITDEENFAVEPFVDLCGQHQYEHTQVIVAGAAFDGLEGVNRISLLKTWS